MIPTHPGHPSRDSGTERADRGNVGQGLQERAVPARRLTPAGLIRSRYLDKIRRHPAIAALIDAA
jgi:hypothetical protein